MRFQRLGELGGGEGDMLDVVGLDPGVLQRGGDRVVGKFYLQLPLGEALLVGRVENPRRRSRGRLRNRGRPRSQEHTCVTSTPARICAFGYLGLQRLHEVLQLYPHRLLPVPVPYGDQPALLLLLPEHDHIGDLLHLRLPYLVLQGLVRVCRGAPSPSRPLSCWYILLGVFLGLVGYGDHLDLHRREPGGEPPL